MALYNYRVRLTDIGLGLLVGRAPQMRIRLDEEAFGPDGIVSAVPVDVPIDAEGIARMSLIPSGELRPSRGGAPGMPYTIEVGRFEQSIDGYLFHGVDTWRFEAAPGGGNIADMTSQSLLAIWVGPPVNPWPSDPLPYGLYIDPTPPMPWGIRGPND